MCRGQSHWREHHPGDHLGRRRRGKVGHHTKQRLERRATGILRNIYIYYLYYITVYHIILYYRILYYIILYVEHTHTYTHSDMYIDMYVCMYIYICIDSFSSYTDSKIYECHTQYISLYIHTDRNWRFHVGIFTYITPADKWKRMIHLPGCQVMASRF